MDGLVDIGSAPFRDARYAPRQVMVERRADGGLILTNTTPVIAQDLTMTEALERWARLEPDRLWLAQRGREGWEHLSYGEGAAKVAAIAGGLAARGLGRGQPVLILARNSIDHALISYAAMSLGVPIAPVSPQYGLAGADLSRLAYAVALIKPAAVYVDDALAFAGALDSPALAGLMVIASQNARSHDLGLADLLTAPPHAAIAVPDDIAKLLLTSGSTGKPKAVMCLHSNICTNAAQITACYDDPDPPIVVNAAPWSHSLGANAILHMITHRGGSLYIDTGQPTPGGFEETLRNLREIAPTYHNMVPAGWGLFAGALEQDEALARRFFSRVRVLQYGGANLAQSICDRIQAVAVRLTGERLTFATGYGSTETGPTASNIHWLNDRTGMCGLPVPGTSVKLAPQGNKFEMRVKGPQVSPGYYGAPDLSAKAFDEDGFYRLGDAARLLDEADPEAGLVFDGRLVENFKLASGTFVAAGSLRIAAVSAIGGAVSDAVVCGEGREGVGLLLFLNGPYCAQLDGPEAISHSVQSGLARMNAAAKGGGGKIARAMILADAPDPVSGEITDKGYINQALSRQIRAAEVERLFADRPDADILCF
jgi:feruloyl-CoA synthase